MRVFREWYTPCTLKTHSSPVDQLTRNPRTRELSISHYKTLWLVPMQCFIANTIAAYKKKRISLQIELIGDTGRINTRTL